MIRTQIQLTEKQARWLKARAAEAGRSMADLIRESVERSVADAPARRSADALRDDALAIVGKYRSSRRDLARNHDRYLAEDLAR